jgi:nucleoprotein TPR
MQTRRKSKIVNEVHAEVGEANVSQPINVDAVGGDAPFTVHLPENIDLDTLKTLLPDFDVVHPTPEAILSVYQLILRQNEQLEDVAQDRDAARADVTRCEVELDQALQDRDVQTRQLRTSLDETQAELVKSQRLIHELGQSILTLPCHVRSLPHMPHIFQTQLASPSKLRLQPFQPLKQLL